MAYDEVRKRIVMFGGLRGGTLDELWDYDGMTWTRLDVLNGPLPRYLAGMVFDRSRGQVIVVGGSTGSGGITDTWTLGYRATESSQVCTTSIDTDQDAQGGCDDDDCALICGGCGDGVCDNGENCRSCPDDCATNTAACPTVCGDDVCDPGETHATCVADCP